MGINIVQTGPAGCHDCGAVELHPYHENASASEEELRLGWWKGEEMSEIYISVDIEADGPIPGPHSMLSIGAAAFELPDRMISTWSANLENLPGATGHPDTMKWWLESNADAWEACRKNRIDPKVAMTEFSQWVNSLKGSPVFVSYPAGFDFTFVYWYLMKFCGRSPFGFSALGLQSAAMVTLDKSFRMTTKRNMPKKWFEGLPRHTHVALDDAVAQGMLFCRIQEECGAKSALLGKAIDVLARMTKAHNGASTSELEKEAEDLVGRYNALR